MGIPSSNKTPHSPSWHAWRRFKRNYPAMLSAIFILACCLMIIPGYLILPDSTPNANMQALELETKSPGFTASFLLVRKNESEKKTNLLEKIISGEDSKFNRYYFTSYHIKDDKIYFIPYPDSTTDMMDSFSLADVIYPLKPDSKIQKIGKDLQFHLYTVALKKAPIATLEKEVQNSHIGKQTFLLGTDRFGRDMLSRLILGTRISLSVGLISVSISLVIGLVSGALAGFFGGMVDSIIRWFINVVWSIPTFLLVMAIALIYMVKLQYHGVILKYLSANM